MTDTFAIKQNDTSPPVRATLSDGDGDPVNLSGVSVRFLMKTRQGAEPKVNESATVDNATEGRVSYTWQGTDTDTPGIYIAEWEVTYDDDNVETFPNDGYLRVHVRRDIA